MVFTRVFVAFHFASSAFTVPLFLSFRILCIASSAAAGVCGFWRLSGFGFSQPLLSQLALALAPASSASQVPLVPPATPLSIKMHA